ncbi:MAG: Cob(I)yrinic acid a,c-diamide adenosyltransferase [candidate division WS2 bacterium]|uniref:Cob(I)yrinic acid a,c-diamide adenosyltransferase n=1 Tax=Psychracetigena formicireducens TaxID=2986056 RepID=A0A9E2BFY8_PSYF1|nr:Cob(I)yrinic acid a,c-diamide adenosyltransferase [Candidatus Psychracetigena formicireducens]MBT9144172.1 Cob(I)yrinic acid a,c-diamide adenosyltransferase [Candidatus Psychracetigena formicireducens]MBT9150006.1 Cob(I)yrinic acid a,c-diamide adenosyltransferase [Candidatus Psychracetigena formicireducens]
MKRKGLVQVYTGDGKGKTTAAIGLSVRAKGCKLKLCYEYFHKDPEKWGSGEQRALEKFGVDVIGTAKKHPRFLQGEDLDEIRFRVELRLKKPSYNHGS